MHDTQHVWTLCEGEEDNLGLSCTRSGLFLGRTALLERQDDCFTVRPENELQRLLSSGFGFDVALDRVTSGLRAVAAALNSGDLCRARIAAVHLRIPELPDQLGRLAMETEDTLLKLERRASRTEALEKWDPALHPRAGTAPNPGWFAPAADASDATLTPVSDPPGAAPKDENNEDPVRLPPGDRIDELGDLLEWIVNAKPEDEQAIRQEIKRLYYDVGDVEGGNMMNKALSDALDPGLTRHDREELLQEYEPYTRSDPAEVAQLGRDLTTGALLFPQGVEIAAPAAETAEAADAEITAPAAEAAEAAEAASAVWKLGWARRGREIEIALGKGLGVKLPDNFPVIDYFPNGIATSIKSVDLNGATYQSAQRLSARINTYVDQLAEFAGRRWGGSEVQPSAIVGRELNVAIPKGSATATQRSAMDAAIESAKARGVTLKFTPF